jgi:hypothetical protein
MPLSYDAQKEGRISLALQAFLQGYFKSLRAAASSYNVSHIIRLQNDTMVLSVDANLNQIHEN